MISVDAFLDTVARVLPDELAKTQPESEEPRHWIVISDQISTEITEVHESKPHEALRSLIDRGVDGAAYVTYVARPTERVLAYVLVAAPRDSDIRQAAVLRTGNNIALGRWEYTV